jgi:hypothetical protein
MSYRPHFWGVDPDTGQDIPIFYDELEVDTRKNIIKPVGGFIFQADAFMLKDLAKVPFYVKDLLPKRGKALLYAPPKAGKSYLCLQLARCIGAEEDFLGIPTKQGKVLYIQFELGEEILQGRLLSTGKRYDDVYVGTSFSLKIDSAIGQERLWNTLEVVEPNVLILDPWYKSITCDENEAADIIKVTDFLDSLIEGFNCSILIIHHAGKDITKRGRGSSVLEDWVDSYMQMKKVSKKGEPLKVKIDTVFLRHAPPWEEPVAAELQDFEFVRTDAAPTVKGLVEKFVKEQKGVVEPKQIFNANIGTNTSVYNALKELVKEGKIKKVGQGKYEA